MTYEEICAALAPVSLAETTLPQCVDAHGLTEMDLARFVFGPRPAHALGLQWDKLRATLPVEVLRHYQLLDALTRIEAAIVRLGEVQGKGARDRRS